jgi:hypothetical protein
MMVMTLFRKSLSQSFFKFRTMHYNHEATTKQKEEKKRDAREREKEKKHNARRTVDHV